MTKVLMDLHPCFDGFSGIPQDTRVTFGLLSESEQVELGGHLLSAHHGTTCFPWKNQKHVADTIGLMSEFIIGLDVRNRRYDYGVAETQLIRNILKQLCKQKHFHSFLKGLINRGFIQPSARLHRIDAEFFEITT